VKAALLALLPLLLPGPRGGVGEWRALLQGHLAHCPAAAAEDVYKFVHQSVYGPAHAVPDREEAARYLEAEVAGLLPGPAAEPTYELLDGGVRLARVNLRPYLAHGGGVGALLDAFVTTAARVKGDPAVMGVRLGSAVDVLKGAGRGGDAEKLETLAAAMGARGFPAVHHSEAYRRTYRPAYRVVLLELLHGS